MASNVAKRKYFHFCFFAILYKNTNLHFLRSWIFFTLCVVPIMIQTWSVPQNDCLNLSFVKDFCIVGTKMARNGGKMAIYQMPILMINLWFSQDLVEPQDTFYVITFEPIMILTC